MTIRRKPYQRMRGAPPINDTDLEHIRGSVSMDRRHVPPVIRIKDLGLAALANEGFDLGDYTSGHYLSEQNRLIGDRHSPATLTLDQATAVIYGLSGATDPVSLGERLKLLDPNDTTHDPNTLVKLAAPFKDVLLEMVYPASH